MRDRARGVGRGRYAEHAVVLLKANRSSRAEHETRGRPPGHGVLDKYLTGDIVSRKDGAALENFAKLLTRVVLFPEQSPQQHCAIDPRNHRCIVSGCQDRSLETSPTPMPTVLRIHMIARIHVVVPLGGSRAMRERPCLRAGRLISDDSDHLQSGHKVHRAQYLKLYLCATE